MIRTAMRARSTSGRWLCQRAASSRTNCECGANAQMELTLRCGPRRGRLTMRYGVFDRWILVAFCALSVGLLGWPARTRAQTLGDITGTVTGTVTGIVGTVTGIVGGTTTVLGD